MEDIFQIQVRERHLRNLAEINQVRQIEEVYDIEVVNNVARSMLKADVVMKGFDRTSYSGKGQVVAVADSGLDTGSETNCHPAFEGRVVKLNFGAARILARKTTYMATADT
jgi:serine protease AprX